VTETASIGAVRGHADPSSQIDVWARQNSRTRSSLAMGARNARILGEHN
jgi:hypothetical protein